MNSTDSAAAPGPTGDAAVIVLAGGSGTRVGAGRNKVYLPLGGIPVISWSLSVFATLPGVAALVLVVRPGDRALAETAAAAAPGAGTGGGAAVELVTGGVTRQDSELAGLRQLSGRISSGAVGVVLIHDGARPLVSPELAARVLHVARMSGGAVPGLPRHDLATADPEGVGLAGPAPAGLIAVQTPQGFHAGPLLAAYSDAAVAGFVGTDTASCMARFAPGVPIRAVPGEGRNFKITHQHDLQVAQRVMDRTGTRAPSPGPRSGRA